MPHPGTQELARRMQSVPRTSRGFQTLLPEVRSLRTSLLAQGDKSGLTDLAEKVRLWAPGEKAPAVTARALAEAADVLADAGQWERAAQLLERAVQTNPQDIATVDRAATVLSRGRAFEELHDLLTDHALTLDRRSPNEEALRASCWQRVGKLRAEKLKNIDAAIAAYDTAMQIQPEVSSVRELAMLLEQRGQGDDRDGAADLYCLLGELVEGDESALYYARALTLKPDHPDALTQLRAPAPPSRILPVDEPREFREVPKDPPRLRPAGDSQFAATVLQFPQPAPLPRPSVMPASALPAVSPFAAQHVSSRQPVTEMSVMAKLPMNAFDDVRVPAAGIPYHSEPPPLRRSVPPVEVAPSFAPQAPRAPAGFAQTPALPAPTVSEDTWNTDVPKKRKWLPYASVAAVAACVAGVAVARPDLVQLLARQVGLAKTAASAPASTDSVTGAASGNEGRVEIPAPATPPAVQPSAAAPVAPVAAAPAPVADEKPAQEKPTEEPLAVSIAKGSLRAKGGKLPRGSLNEALEPAVVKFDACYDKALAKKPRLKGAITLAWVVRPNGKVDQVKKVDDSVKDAPLAACTLKALKSADFPRPKGGPVRMRGSFEFDK